MSDAQEVFVGIDVSKEWFDIAVRPGDERWRGSQDEAGVDALTRRLQQMRPHLVMGGIGWVRAAHHRRLGGRGIADRSGESTTGPRLCPLLGKAGQDGPDRCGGDCALRSSRRCGAAAVALGRCARTRRPGDTPQAGSADEGRRAGAPRAGPTRRPGAYRPSATLLKQELKEIDDDLSKRLRESPVWRERVLRSPRRPYAHLHAGR